MINPRPHKKLTLWQRAIDLVTDIYKMTESFPAKGGFGLIAQWAFPKP
ncbi:hypothetical protein D4R75_16205 [bacterium]|nr:MAG: hypothetical protein D4R75_16205 [bacterium]